jgi:hypothetical protein
MTKLSEWRSKSQRTWELPTSGLTVVTRKVDLLTLAGSGGIPQTLNALTERAANQGINIDDLTEFAPLLDATVKACLIEPLIGDVADDLHILLIEIPLADRMAIFTWANGEAEALSSFRQEQGGDVESAPASDGIPLPSE